MKYIQLFSLIALLSIPQILSAQSENKTYEITITTIDEDGNKEVKEMLLEGNISQEEIDDLIQEELDGVEGEVDINVNVNVSGDTGKDSNAKTITKIIKQRSNSTDEKQMIIEDEEMEIEVIDDKVYINGEEVKEGDFGGKRVRIMKFEDGDDIDVKEILENEGIEIGKDESVYFIDSEQSESGVAFLGVSPGKITDEGLTISKVIPGTSAEDVGLEVGDVLMSIDGKKIEGFNSLSKIVKSYLPDETVKVVYKRVGDTKEVVVKLSDYEAFADNEVSWYQKRSYNPHDYMKGEKHRAERHHKGHRKGREIENKAALGVVVEKVDGKLVVTKVKEDSPAAKVGIQEGDIILKVNKAEMLSEKQLYFTIRAYEVGDDVNLKISRNGKKKKMTATLEPMLPKRKKFKHNNSMRKERIIIKDRKERREDRRANHEARGAIKINDFNLSPNPSTGSINVDFKMDALESGEQIEVRIISLDGKVLEKEVINDFDGRYTKEFDLSDSGNGIYLLQIEKNKQMLTKRFVIEKK